ncbi:TPA: SPOR domain-containing protein [Candidatus Gastranaerophilales bacterium HUM_20]|nr:unknown [Clostridium sp. CAG:729]DAB21328.1 MAG TPA: SPOR domain-containing protein [Candidatus Gastranaerophilales bacterium HUM_20]
MLDKKFKEQIYYGESKQTSNNNYRAFLIMAGVIVGFAIIIAIISSSHNANTTYQQPTQERNLEDIVNEKPAENAEQQTKPEQKTYTEAERVAGIKAYKNKFISKVKPNWHPEQESFLIDNNSLEVKIDKYGNVTFPEFEKIGFSNANTTVMKYAIEDGMPYEPLPESYNNETLTFRIYFEGNTDSYWGNAQPKSSYQVSLSPIKPTYKQTTTQSKPQTNSIDKEPSPKPETPVDNIKYKVVVGYFATKEQAALARKLIVTSDKSISPTIWQSGVNNFTLLLGTFNDKTSAEALYNELKGNSYPVRIIEEKF